MRSACRVAQIYHAVTAVPLGLAGILSLAGVVLYGMVLYNISGRIEVNASTQTMMCSDIPLTMKFINTDNDGYSTIHLTLVSLAIEYLGVDRLQASCNCISMERTCICECDN